jgi:arsenate reductase
VVVTLCDQADDECPVWLGKGRILHRPFPDPANVTGSEVEKLTAFYEVRDGIAKDIAVLLAL